MTIVEFSKLKSETAEYLLGLSGWKTPTNLKNYREEFYGQNLIVYFSYPDIVVLNREWGTKYCSSVEELRQLLEK